jgi:short-subunit dehydrogenase
MFMNGTSPKGAALITGASAGIGRELAICFARGGYDCILVARREEKLWEVKSELERRFKIHAQVLAEDLADPEAPRRIAQGLADAPISVLVNNAGFGDYGPFAQADEEKMLQVLQVNVVALTHLTRLLLPRMKLAARRRRTRILNVGSTAGFLPGPLMAVYYASKSYVLSFSEALSTELEGSNVSVTCLCPGPTQSEFQEVAGMQPSKLSQGVLMDAQSVARAGYEGCLRGQTLVIPGASNRALAFVPRLLPRSLTARLVRRVQERK